MTRIIMLTDCDVIADYRDNWGRNEITDLSEYNNEYGDCYTIREFATQAEADAYIKGVDDVADGLLDYAFADEKYITGIDE